MAPNGSWESIPADAFMEILQRIPSSPRRRLRLVCRHWRSVIDDHMPGETTQARAMVLAFLHRRTFSEDTRRAYIFDDLTKAETNSGRLLELQGAAESLGSIVVGTCNGLLCLCRLRGDVVVVNPVTGEKLAVPPPPPMRDDGKFEAATYSFTYHPATGLYKVVHFPFTGEVGTFDTVNVFTLGDSSWREVPVRFGSSCRLSFGIVSVNGATYWVSNDGCSIMSFDLEADERVVFVTTLPAVRLRLLLVDVSIYCQLTTDMDGRLGVAICSHDMKQNTTLQRIKTEMWVLDDRRRNKTGTTSWVLRHTILEPGQEKPLQKMARPHVTHGDHVLSTQEWGNDLVSLNSCRMREGRTTPAPWIGAYYCSGIRAFAYVETTEPLALYACHDGEFGGDVDWKWAYDHWGSRWKLKLNRVYFYVEES